MYKVMLKVSSGNSLVWREFCTLPYKLYRDYCKLIRPLDLNAHISMWAHQDFGVDNKMISAEDLEKLKCTIIEMCKKSYWELYIVDGLEIDGSFWVSLWLASHLQFEVKR